MSRKLWDAGTCPRPALISPGAIPGTAFASCSTVVPLGRKAIVMRGEAASARDGAPANRQVVIASIATMAERTFIKFTFLKIDPAWQRREGEQRAQDKRELLAACEDYATDRPLRAYSTVGTRGDTDLLIVSQSPHLTTSTPSTSSWRRAASRSGRRSPTPTWR